MNEPTKKYQLLPGAKYSQTNDRGQPVRVEPGAVVDLNARQALAFRDKFVPVKDGFPGIVHPHLPTMPPQPTPIVQPMGPPPEATPESSPDPPADAVETKGRSASTIIELLGRSDVATVTRIHEDEAAKRRARKTILAAAKDRLEELSG